MRAGRKLAVDTGRGEFAEEIFVKVPLSYRTAPGGSSLIISIRLHQKRRLHDHEVGVLHVLAEGGVFAGHVVRRWGKTLIAYRFE